MCQGDRKSHRDWWINTRMYYLDSKYDTGAFESDYAVLRLYTPTSTDTNSAVYKSITVVPPDPTFHITNMEDGYLKVTWRDTSNIFNTPDDIHHSLLPHATANVQHTVSCPIVNPSFNDTDTHIFGASKISDLGDLSPMYCKTVDISKLIHLEKLVLGNANENYVNNNITSVNVDELTLLKYLDIRGCYNDTYFTALSLTNNYMIDTVYAERSSLQTINLLNGSNISTLHLGSEITQLKLWDLSKLTDF